MMLLAFGLIGLLVVCVFIALGFLFSSLRATRKKRSNLTNTAEPEELSPLLGVVHPKMGWTFDDVNEEERKEEK